MMMVMAFDGVDDGSCYDDRGGDDDGDDNSDNDDVGISSGSGSDFNVNDSVDNSCG